MEKLAATNGLEYVRIMDMCGHNGADEREFRVYRKGIVEADRSAAPYGAGHVHGHYDCSLQHLRHADGTSEGTARALR